MTRADSTEYSADLFGWSSPISSDKPDHYPARPGYRGGPDGPSAQAAKLIAPTVTGRRREVLDLLRTKAEPMTADQIAVAIGRSILSVRSGVAELHAMGLIEAAAERGKNESGMSANRWRAAREVAS